MELGVVFPQTEIGSDPAAVRDFAQAAESIGFSHLLIYDHVLGADPDRPDPLPGPYTKDHLFHEPFVTLGYLAGVTTTIEFAPAVIILPQRQTALVAKQAAQIDLLSGGRLRLGVGTGWNWVEYEALGENFHDRGRRQEEQIDLMRRLWSEEVVSYKGRWHRVTKAGLNPLPSRQIPIWFGGGADALLKRAARIGDGWMAVMATEEKERSLVDRLHGYLKEAGRAPDSFGIQARDRIRDGDPESWRRNAERWRSLGATHLAVVTMDAGLARPDAHIDAIRRYWDALA
ncbi:MAG: LLM class F420-dependent oxidoreductase [Dehalococcoidia bacterium]